MSNLESVGWVLFVEDPGAVNYFVPLIQDLQRREMPFQLYAAGHAVALLTQRGIVPLNADDIVDLPARVSLVVVGTSENIDTFAFELVAKAKQQKVPCVGIVDSGVNATHRFCGRSSEPLLHAPDYLLVPDDWSAAEYKKLGFAQERVFVVGYPMQNRLRSSQPKDVIRARILPQNALDRFVLVFISEISTGLNPQQYQKSDDYSLHGRGESTLRTEIVVEELLDAINSLDAQGVDRPFMVLRRHPKETQQDLLDLADEFDLVSNSGDPLELVYGADLVVGMSSMLLNEAHLLGTPTLAVVPRPEETDWLPSVRNGAIPWAADRLFLRDTLARLLSECADRRTDGSNLPVAEQTVFDPMKYLISISRQSN